MTSAFKLLVLNILFKNKPQLKENPFVFKQSIFLMQNIFPHFFNHQQINTLLIHTFLFIAAYYFFLLLSLFCLLR